MAKPESKSYSFLQHQKLAKADGHFFTQINIRQHYYTMLVRILILLTSGETLHFFDVFELHSLLEKASPIHQTVLGFHYLISVMIYPLFAIHITAAIYHQIFGLLEDN